MHHWFNSIASVIFWEEFFQAALLTFFASSLEPPGEDFRHRVRHPGCIPDLQNGLEQGQSWPDHILHLLIILEIHFLFRPD